MYKRTQIYVFGGWVGLIGLGCAVQPKEENSVGTEQRIELHDLNDTFGLAFVPPKALTDGEQLNRLKDRLERQSFPIQATGSVHTKMRDGSGDPLTYQSIGVRGTCGATLISPSYVVTAAHCVDSGDVLVNDSVTLEMYRPERRLADEAIWRPRTQLTGTFPDYQRIPFTAADGYHVDHYSCQVKSRCGNSWGVTNCPSTIADSGDIALLYCEGQPGAQYGYLNVAESEQASVEVFVPWKHEVYDIPETEPVTSDRYQHYVKYPSTGVYAENFHYLGDERNQLLPLMSQPWPDGTPHRKLSTTSSLSVWTDVLACHGTSGSGFLQRDERSGEWQLLGPAVGGGGNIAGFLCHHNPGVIGQPVAVPGQASISYSSLVQTSAVVAAFDTQIAEDCAPVNNGSFSLPTRSRCERLHSGLNIAQRMVYSDFSPWNLPVVRLAVGTTEVGKVKVVAGHKYRAIVKAATSATCGSSLTAVATCPELVVRFSDKTVLGARFERANETVTSGGVFTAETSGTLSVSLQAAGGTFELGELTLIDEQRTNGFDLSEDRLQVALVVPNVSATAPLPARFVGDGQQGFSALLYGGERLVLNREAVALRGTFDVSFTTPDTGTVRCGFLGQDGTVLMEKTCSPGNPNHFEMTGAAVPTALFFEAPLGIGPFEIDSVQVITSDNLPNNTCNDQVKNGSETDVDCGGGTCLRCTQGAACSLSADCLSSNCVNGLCAALPTCSDNIKNGSETDVDCGGSCTTDCAVGKACLTNADCTSASCVNGLCVALPTCSDNIKNGSETDVDCGGSCTTDCAVGKACLTNADCTSTSCVNGLCAALPTCSDNIKNGSETDVDCGGSCATDCAVGKACLTNADCTSSICTNNKCVAPSSGLSAAVQVSSDWPSGYCANITVTNSSTTTRSGWTVVFDTKQAAMNNGWSAQFTNTGSVYQAKAMSWNSVLGAKQSTTFGYCANKTGTNTIPIIISVSSP